MISEKRAEIGMLVITKDHVGICKIIGFEVSGRPALLAIVELPDGSMKTYPFPFLSSIGNKKGD